MLFIGTQFSNLYTAVDTPARGRVVVCLVFVCLVFACKYVLRHSRVSQPLNLWLCLLRHLAFSLRLMPPRPAADAALTHTGSSTDLHQTLLPFHGPIPFTFLTRPDLHYIHLQCVDDNLINDSLKKKTQQKEQTKESLELNLAFSPSP